MSNDDGQPNNTTRDGDPKPSDAITNQHNVGSTEAKPKDKSTNPQDRRLRSACFRRMRIGWRKAQWHDIVVAIATVVIAGVGIGQFIVYLQMKVIMESSGEQTQKLIDAANIQATSASRVSISAQKFSTSADSINTQTQLAVNKFDRMAKASESSIATIQKTAKDALDASIEAARLDERPWVVIQSFSLTNEPEEGKMPTARIWVKNTGKTPALDMLPTTTTFIGPYALPLGGTIEPRKSMGLLSPGPSDMSFAASVVPFDKKPIDDYNRKISFYYVRAMITYVDVNKVSHWTVVCIYHTHGEPLTEYQYCPEGNDVDRNK
jgi:hypothetical protein